MEGLRTLSEWETRDPIRNLWRNVLIVLIEDLIKLTKIAARFNHVGEEQQEAIKYFTTVGEDFDMICELSGFDEEYVRSKVLKEVNKIQIKENKHAKSYMPQVQREWIQPSTY